MKAQMTKFFKNTQLIYILILGGIIGILLPALISGFILVQNNHTVKIDNLKRFGTGTLNNLSSALRGHLWDLREDLAKELLQTVILNRDIHSVKVIDTTSNKVFVNYTKPSLEGEHLLYFQKPIYHNTQKIGVLELVLTEYYVYEDINDISIQFFYIFAGQLIISLALIFFVLYHKVLQPLKRLNQQADLFSKENFNERFIWSRKDEMGIVGKNFDNAREKLLTAQQFSQEYKSKLQYEVALKTKELKELNENLEQRVAEELDKNKKQNILLQQQARLATLGEMIGNIAHQWRQRLSAITTRASSLSLKHSLNLLGENEIEETTDGIIKSANFLSQTIEDFRNFLQTDKEKKKFNVEKTIYNIYNIVKSSFEANNIMVDFHIDENIDYTGYPNELSQVILNILNNAKDALVTHTTTEKFIYLESKIVENNLLIKISDNGGGIPEKIISKIFDPYFTTKHKNQGTGIGLYMSMQIIKDNFNGEFYVKNE